MFTKPKVSACRVSTIAFPKVTIHPHTTHVSYFLNNIS